MESNRNDIEGRASAPCSPTPETSKAWDDASKAPDGNYYSNVRGQDMAVAMLDHSRRMERERNAAIFLLQRTHYNLIGRHGWGDPDATLIGDAMGWDSGNLPENS